jgi:hypothetical protein
MLEEDNNNIESTISVCRTLEFDGEVVLMTEEEIDRKLACTKLKRDERRRRKTLCYITETMIIKKAVLHCFWDQRDPNEGFMTLSFPRLHLLFASRAQPINRMGSTLLLPVIT